VSFFLPGGLFLLATTLLLHSGQLRASNLPAVQFGFYVTVCSGLLVSWRFRCTRVIFSLLALFLVEEAVAGGWLLTRPDRITTEIAAFLLPISFLTFSFLPERGFTMDALVPRIAVLLIDFVAMGISGYQTILRSHRSSLPLAATLFLWAALSVFVIRFLKLRRAIESGFFWGLLAIFFGLRAGGGAVFSSAYVTAAAVILGASVVESSYFMAYHDELTGLPTRRCFNEVLASLRGCYSIAVVDIDHFKLFNDQYGHDTGDQVLRMVAARLARVTGGGEAFRCGGEEFALVFRGKTAPEALPHLESLRQAVAQSVFKVRGYERRKEPRGQERRQATNKQRARRAWPPSPQTTFTSVTVSIGVADHGPSHGTVEQVISAADKALYTAKRGGRNCVEIAGVLQPRAKPNRRSKTMAASGP
jgi:GGDEF domain-containing protein